MRKNKSKTQQRMIKTIQLFSIIWVLVFSCQAMADMVFNSLNSSDKYSHWVRATDSELAGQRGGFVLPNGVNIDLSLEKIIFLNGVETFSSFFQFPEDISLVQNGNQNLANLTGSGLSSVIQNNLDNQVIRTVNEINIAVSNLQNLDLKGNQVFTDFIMPNVQ